MCFDPQKNRMRFIVVNVLAYVVISGLLGVYLISQVNELVPRVNFFNNIEQLDCVIQGRKSIPYLCDIRSCYIIIHNVTILQKDFQTDVKIQVDGDSGLQDLEDLYEIGDITTCYDTGEFIIFDRPNLWIQIVITLFISLILCAFLVCTPLFVVTRAKRKGGRTMNRMYLKFISFFNMFTGTDYVQMGKKLENVEIDVQSVHAEAIEM